MIDQRAQPAAWERRVQRRGMPIHASSVTVGKFIQALKQ